MWSGTAKGTVDRNYPLWEATCWLQSPPPFPPPQLFRSSWGQRLSFPRCLLVLGLSLVTGTEASCQIPHQSSTSLVIFTRDLVVSAHFSARFNSTSLLRGLKLPGREVFANLRFGESSAQNNSDLNLQPVDLQGRGFLVRRQLMGLYSKAEFISWLLTPLLMPFGATALANKIISWMNEVVHLFIHPTNIYKTKTNVQVLQ